MASMALRIAAGQSFAPSALISHDPAQFSWSSFVQSAAPGRRYWRNAQRAQRCALVAALPGRFASRRHSFVVDTRNAKCARPQLARTQASEGGATATLAEEKEEEQEDGGFVPIFTRMPPRDWPPDGWYVPDEELDKVYSGEEEWLVALTAKLEDPEFVKELEAKGEGAGGPVLAEGLQEGQFKRWRAFLDQYHDWRAANKERLDREAEEDMEYMPGRRRVGKYLEIPTQDPDVKGMYELPFIEEGQIYAGFISSIDLYCGAFVAFGGVHDGWVQIVREDWLKVRDLLPVGTKVLAEVTAKRDPFRFRFPIEMRLLDPKIDHLLEKSLGYPPIIGRPGDYDLDEVMREAGRPLLPKRRPPKPPKGYKEPKWQHPDVRRAYAKWMAEQVLIDREEYEEAVARGEDPGEKPFDEPEDIDWKEVDSSMLMDESELDLEKGRRERQELRRQYAEANKAGVEFVPRYSYQDEIEELEKMQEAYYASMEQMEAKYNAERALLGLPPEEEPGFMDPALQQEEDIADMEYSKEDPRFRREWSTGFDPMKLNTAEATGEDSEEVFKKWKEEFRAGVLEEQEDEARSERYAKSAEAERQERWAEAETDSAEHVKRDVLEYFEQYAKAQEEAKAFNKGPNALGRGFERGTKAKAKSEGVKDVGVELDDDEDEDVEDGDEETFVVGEDDDDVVPAVVADDDLVVATDEGDEGTAPEVGAS